MPPPPPGAFRIVSEDSVGSHGRRAGIGSSSHRRQQDEQEQRAWDRSSTGKHASLRHSGLLRWTRFVREGEGQPQHGQSSKDDEGASAPSPPPPPSPLPQAQLQTQQSMAGLYAQLTANIASPSTSESGPSRITTNDEDIPSPPVIPATARCPTCSTLLPNPCPSSVLRTHLVSLAHRLSLSGTNTPRATIPTSSSKDPRASAEATTARLHLDAQNSGYVMLHNMGWREGAGLGVEEWEFLQHHQHHHQPSGSRDRSRDPIVVEDEEDEEADIFDADQQDLTRAATTSSPPISPQSESSTSAPAQRPPRKARLVPITPAYKNDRRGLGITPPPSHKSQNNKHSQRRHTSHTSTRKQREQQLRADAHRLQTIRDSLR